MSLDVEVWSRGRGLFATARCTPRLLECRRFLQVVCVAECLKILDGVEPILRKRVQRLGDGSFVVDFEIEARIARCQGFSPLNMRGVGMERTGLWREYLRALDEAEPRAFVMENVPELLRSADYQAFRSAATSLGFAVEGRVLNAADYGIPQTRKRAFVIGIRDGEPAWPEPGYAAPGKEMLGQLPWRTFRQAVRGLPLQPDDVCWHRARNPRAISVERYRTIPGEGEGRFDLARRRPDITPPCWLRKKSGSTDVFGRLWWERPAFTIRTEFYKPEKGRYLHPSEHRPITLREAARCMAFPDDFAFPEHQPMTAVAQQIGNAVCPELARQIAATLKEQLLGVEAKDPELDARSEALSAAVCGQHALAEALL